MKPKHVLSLLKKDFTIDLRQKYALTGAVLFAVGSSYLIYRTFPQVNAQSWNVFLWIITIYAGINAVSKTFSQELQNTMLYYYSLVSAEEVIVSKLLYNFLFMLGIISILIFAFFIFLGDPIKFKFLFFKGLLLGITGISIVLTFVSSVSGSDAKSGTIMAILTLPLMLPLVMLMSKITSVAMRLITDTSVNQDLILLGGIDIVLLSLVLIIFPTLWKS